MKIGITGWKGFIGSHLKSALEKTDNELVLFEGNLCNLADCQIFVRRCDRIYHIAGHNRDTQGKILANNLFATGHLVLACKIEHVEPEIVFASSRQITMNPDSEFGFTKITENCMISQMSKWCIFVIPNVYGEGCRPFYNSVVGTFAYQITHGKTPTINNPTDTREFIYIDDLIEDLLEPHFNETLIPAGEQMTTMQVYEYMTSRLGQHNNLTKTLEWYRSNL
jgi:UDP-2-acetamido-2,6-beta-L-arabino-hexul-4-ose reductase